MWTAGEIFEALDGEKAIIPVKIDNSQYNKKFKLLIRPLDYIDYQENPQNALIKYFILSSPSKLYQITLLYTNTFNHL